MHLLSTRNHVINDGSEAVDLGQTSAEMVVLTAADSERAALAAACDRLGAAAPKLRLASVLELGHPLSVDLYVEAVVARARLVVVRLLGGINYWRYGLEQVYKICQERGIALAVLPGDDRPDPTLESYSTLDATLRERLWACLCQGGTTQVDAFLLAAAAYLRCEDVTSLPLPPPEPRTRLYWPGLAQPSLDDLRAYWRKDAPVVGIIFYRALVLADNCAVVVALIDALRQRGLNPLPVAVSSLREAADSLAQWWQETQPGLILCATAFAAHLPPAGALATWLGTAAPVWLQLVFAGSTREAWDESRAGLAPRDLAMHVALPEMDGHVLSRAVSFKAEDRWHNATETRLLHYQPLPDRIDFAADLTAAWLRLRHTPPRTRRVAILLANYPNRDGRLANGVGLDTPASVVASLRALAAAGYDTGAAPTDSAALMAHLGAGVTNDLEALDQKTAGETLLLTAYQHFFARLPLAVQTAVNARWGDPASDPHVRGEVFRLPLHRFGNVIIGIQPARGYHIDPQRSYHDPDLPPPHAYLATYAWLRGAGAMASVHALIHFGKHGNLEWLPGKALALSAACFPEAILGPLPHLYPFIVNDPGEGSQAKRRTAAVILDHLTPPLTRAETYGPLRTLEARLDEYYEASALDPRRLPLLKRDILDLAADIGLDRDLGFQQDGSPDAHLEKLDNHLCELKELQIRDGLHIFGSSPQGAARRDLLAALVRVPRGRGEGGDAALLQALVADMALGDGFDPLDIPDMAAPWRGPRPALLSDLLPDQPWRTHGDTLERLEALGCALLDGHHSPPAVWTHTAAVLHSVATHIAPALDACGAAETAALLTGLDGRFVAPGPSGAPTRGRPEVLPTGRNFYSVDTRAVPTPTAWRLGWASACRLLERHLQDQGEPLRTAVLSAWGTANMRTGGDDIAQALALMGVEPRWDTTTGRVTGFAVLPLSVLDRPRVDVTLRVSGFFRDAFPGLIELVDSAARALADLGEPEAMNPLAARVRHDSATLEAAGVAADTARDRARLRVFGSKPGAYGAGLQALIDEGGWQTRSDFAAAVLAWGGFAYGGGHEGTALPELLSLRLTTVQAVLHNQDNREHDLLDSDDYYQFEGGLSATVEHLRGTRPALYHNDHSRPESPRIRTLEEEIARVVRARVVNPKWISGVMRHGYKGAFELAATVDYMFAFAATTGAVQSYQFDLVYDAYIVDDTVREFMANANPAALAEMAARLLEAQTRGLWQPRANSAVPVLGELAEQPGRRQP